MPKRRNDLPVFPGARAEPEPRGDLSCLERSRHDPNRQERESPFSFRHRWLAACLLLPWIAAGAAAPEPGSNEFLDMSLNELLSLEITSVSKRPQSISQAAAAVFVITQDDIRRSGVTSIPEALRLAPGIQVARIDGNKWAISARGFNSRFSNKLLVLMDGRSVYSPSFGGVYWDVQDTLLQDIDRIEVIRGPGASLWGSNAVNGVINIITRKALDTQGNLLNAGGGNQENGFAGFRHGGEIADLGHYRVYGKFYDRGANRILRAEGTRAGDQSDMYRTGFRADLTPSAQDSVTVQGDYYNGSSGNTGLRYSLMEPYVRLQNDAQRVTGFNLLSRWQRELSSTASLTVQGYFDRTERRWFVADEVRNTADLDLHYRTQYFEGHDLLLGFGYRYSGDQFTAGTQVAFNPASYNSQLFSAFLQDDMVLVPDRFTLTLGSKLEHNDFSGFEAQPNIRALWTPAQGHSIWGSIGRAVRIPTRGDQDAVIDRGLIPPGRGLNTGPIPVSLQVIGSREFDAESVLAYELGYKVQPAHNLSLDIALYYNDYTRLRSSGPGVPRCYPNGGSFPVCTFGAQALYLPLALKNAGGGQVYGMELAADWRPSDNLRFQGSYSISASHLHASGAEQQDSDNGNHPNHVFSLRTSWNPDRDVDVDLWLRYMDRLNLLFAFERTPIPAYTQLDARIAWRLLPKLELSVTGQNLLDDRHPEFISEAADMPQIEIKRSIYGQIRWDF